MKSGRNDPCQCGSGRKYKHCCLAASVEALQNPQELTWRRIRRANEGLVPKMLQFAAQAYGAAGIDEAWAEFMLWEEDCEGWGDSPQGSAFLPWMLHHWSPDPVGTDVADASLHGVPATQAYLAAHGSRLDPITRRYLEACLVAPFAFYEVLECQPGHGLRVIELFTGVESDVLESSATQSLQGGDILFASLVQCDGVVMIEGMSPVPLPPIDKLQILALRQTWTQRRGPLLHEDLDDYEIELRELYLRLVERVLHPEIPELHNTDGDLLSLQRLIFEIDSPQEAFDALKHLSLDASDESLLADAVYGSDGRLSKVTLVWSKPGNAVHKSWDNTTLGSIEIDGEQLSVRVNSDERAASFKSLVSDALGPRARYRTTEFQDIEQGPAEGGDAAATKAMDDQDDFANLPEVKAQLADFMWQHYETWVGQQIPALGGKTPLEAVQDPEGREMVATLVRQIERDGSRMRPPLDDSIPRRLREQLGLSHG